PPRPRSARAPRDRSAARGASGAASRSSSRPVRCEEVADATHSLQDLRALRIVTELLAEVRDVHVDRAIERLVGAPADVVDELLAGEHAPGPLGEDPEQIELVGREAERRLAEARGAGERIDNERADHDPPRRRPRTPARPPRVGANAGAELARRERLG